MEAAIGIYHLLVLKTVQFLYCALRLTTYAQILPPHSATAKIPIVL